MAAPGPVLVVVTPNLRSAPHGIFGTNCDDVLVNLITVLEFQVTVLQIVDMVAMADSHVAAVRAMLMNVADARGTSHLIYSL